MATNKQASIHTHAVCNAVTLVWGSLRLAPTNKQNDDGKETANFGPGAYGTHVLLTTHQKVYYSLWT